MSLTKMIAIGLTIFVLLIIAIIIFRRKPKKLKNNQFIAKWRELQQLCKARPDWPEALKSADKLLDSALKKRRFKGKTTGARLMAAQRQIKDNDGIWAAHNLTKKIIEAQAADKAIKLGKIEVRQSLESYQQALVDLGAFKRG